MGRLVEGSIGLARRGAGKVFDTIGQTKELLKNKLGIDDDSVTAAIITAGEKVCSLAGRTGMIERIFNGILDVIVPRAYADTDTDATGECILRNAEDIVESASKIYKTSPTGKLGGKPSGKRTKIPSSADSETTRSLERENDSADVKALVGFKVE
ncbi:MAG: hypothetical protein HRU19_12995 [Pseudobacteriovorax sp.]|nr:hypothetical protein [Pseudobacteriovorax sp.]